MRSMSTDPPDASAAPSEDSRSGEETPVRESSGPIGEGLGVFRALILMVIFYVVSASIIWFAWHAWRHWHTH
jgi:hypothetical protein